MACKSVYAANPVFNPDTAEPNGRVTIHTVILFKSPGGRERFRRVSLHSQWGITAAAAKSMLQESRAENPNLQLGGRMIIDF